MAPSLESNKMLAKTANPLSVEVRQAQSRNARKSAPLIEKLIEHVLEQLNYEGAWQVILSTQITRRGEFKFQVCQRKNTAIVCRVKPGDNNTAWEVLLIPPKGYLVDLVVQDLRTVPSSGEMRLVPRPQRKLVSDEKIPNPPLKIQGNEIKIMPVSVPKQPEPIFLAPPEPGNVQVPVMSTPALLAAIDASNPPPQKSLDLPKSEGKILALAKVFNVGENPTALLHGIAAMSFAMERANGHVQRQIAMKLLVQELELHNFVKNHSNYSDPLKVAKVIISGLCDKGWVSRWHGQQRRTTTSSKKPVTRGYLLTPDGWHRLEMVKEKFPSIVSRMFNPSEVIFEKETDRIVETEVDSPKPVPKAEKAKVVDSNIDKISIITPLFESFNKRTKNVEEAKQLVDDYIAQQNKLEKDFEPLHSRLLKLREEMKGLEEKIGLLTSQKASLDKELEEAQQLRDTEQKELEQIKSELKKHIG